MGGTPMPNGGLPRRCSTAVPLRYHNWGGSPLQVEKGSNGLEQRQRSCEFGRERKEMPKLLDLAMPGVVPFPDARLGGWN